MSLPSKCPECGERLPKSARSSSKPVRCPGCGEKVFEDDDDRDDDDRRDARRGRSRGTKNTTPVGLIAGG
jgi:predicted  nucleic acid-binding Zn-ribbon protein